MNTITRTVAAGRHRPGRHPGRHGVGAGAAPATRLRRRRDRRRRAGRRAPVDEIVVVGSQIRGASTTAALPVTVLDQEEILRHGRRHRRRPAAHHSPDGRRAVQLGQQPADLERGARRRQLGQPALARRRQYPGAAERSPDRPAPDQPGHVRHRHGAGPELQLQCHPGVGPRAAGSAAGRRGGHLRRGCRGRRGQHRPRRTTSTACA